MKYLKGTQEVPRMMSDALIWPVLTLLAVAGPLGGVLLALAALRYRRLYRRSHAAEVRLLRLYQELQSQRDAAHLELADLRSRRPATWLAIPFLRTLSRN
jgi:hypothetical protein